MRRLKEHPTSGSHAFWGLRVVVGTGAQNPMRAAVLAAHAETVGAAGLMVIPRGLSRGASATAQHAHFAGILEAAVDLPSVIYNSAFSTKVDTGLVQKMRYTKGWSAFLDPNQVESARATLCQKAAAGDATSRRQALELEAALKVLSTFDKGVDLVLFYKSIMLLEGNRKYEHQFNPTDMLSGSQKAFAGHQLRLFKKWYASWAAGKG